MTYELLLLGGKRVIWEGSSGEDAALAYAAAHTEATVVAWRNANRHGVVAIERPDRVRILEPGDKGW